MNSANSMTERLLFALCLLLLPAMGGANDDDLVTLRVSIMNTAAAKWTYPDTTVEDKVSITFTGTVVYRIVSRADQNMKLELVSFKNQMAVDGKGLNFVEGLGDQISPEIPNPCKWNYAAVQPPARPFVGLTLNAKGYGAITPSTLYLADYVKITQCTGGLGFLGRTHHKFAHGLQAATEQLASAEPCPVEKKLAFTFPAKAKLWEATGQAAEEWPIVVDEGKLRVGTGGLSLQYSVTAGPPSDEDEVDVSVEGYEAWIPKGNLDEPKEPGSDPLQVTVTVHKKGDPKEPREANLNIFLPYDSKNKGVCGNWPQGAGEEEGLRFRQKDFADKGPLLYKDRTHLETAAPVNEVMFRVHAYDYGAWGTLRVTATDKDGKALKVRVRGKDTPDLDIPLDADANRIADAWEKEKAYGRNKDDDGEKVAGQDAKGDGLTLYDEYRGLAVLENGQRAFRRLDPSKKELFVIDPGGSFDPVTWEKTARIKARNVDASWTKADPTGENAPIVNHLSPTAPDRVAYALKIETVEGDEDMDPAKDGQGNSQPRTSQLPGNWVPGYSLQAGSVKSTEYCKVFPERVRKLVAYVAEWLDTALTDPDSEAAAILRNEPLLGVTLAEAKRAQDLLRSGSVREIVARKILTAVTIHEAGHCCGGLPDHQTSPPAGHEAAVRGCLMFNVADMGRLRMVIRTALDRPNDPLAFPYVQFCRDVPVAGYECFKTLNVKDW